MSELDTGAWFAETFEDEAVYRDYLLPLAGVRHPGARLGLPDCPVFLAAVPGLPDHRRQ